MNKLTQLRRAAMDLLARREHGRAELRRKLWRRFSEVEPSDVDSVLDQSFRWFIVTPNVN